MLNNSNILHIFTVLEDLKTFVMFTGFSYCLSPVLASLTETISTDTIYAMTTVMLLANLAFHNYGVQAALLVHVYVVHTYIHIYYYNSCHAMLKTPSIFSQYCLS